MFASLPIFCLFLFYVLFNGITRNPIEAFVSAVTIWGTYLVFSTELLSTVQALRSFGIRSGWGILVLFLICLVMIFKKKWKHGAFLFPERHCDSREKLSIFSIGTISLVLAIIAYSATPNNWDSHTYHLARVSHWIQNHSVAHYFTHIDRQLWMSPWAEYGILHLNLLVGGEDYANFIQWGAWLGCLVFVGWIAEQLAPQSNAKWPSRLFFATLPMGILQASSTQNDLVVSFWLTVLAYTILSCENYNKLMLADSARVGGALGLALFTKGTAYIYALPLLGWYFILLHRKNKSRAVLHFIILIAVVISISTPLYLRNLNYYGGIFGALGQHELTNSPASIQGTVSNFIRNIALQLNGFPSLSSLLEQTIIRVHSWLSIDPNDPRTTWWGWNRQSGFYLPAAIPHEDVAANPLHFCIIFIAICWMIVRRRFSFVRSAIPYGICLLSGGLLFCILLKWQACHSRLHLPLLILAGPLVCSQYKLPKAVWLLLLFYAVPSLFWNSSRSLLGKESLFRLESNEVRFINQKDRKKPYLNLRDFLKSKKCRKIGLIIGNFEWEYPLWKLLNDGDGPSFELQGFDYRASTLRLPARAPCNLVILDPKFDIQLLSQELQNLPMNDFNGYRVIEIRGE